MDKYSEIIKYIEHILANPFVIGTIVVLSYRFARKVKGGEI